MNWGFVQILLCRFLDQVGCNKAESSKKMMSIGTWRNTRGICGGKVEGTTWVGQLQIRKSVTCSCEAPCNCPSVNPIKPAVTIHPHFKTLICINYPPQPLGLSIGGSLHAWISFLLHRQVAAQSYSNIIPTQVTSKHKGLCRKGAKESPG